MLRDYFQELFPLMPLPKKTKPLAWKAIREALELDPAVPPPAHPRKKRKLKDEGASSSSGSDQGTFLALSSTIAFLYHFPYPPPSSLPLLPPTLSHPPLPPIFHPASPLSSSPFKGNQRKKRKSVVKKEQGESQTSEKELAAFLAKAVHDYKTSKK